MTDYLFAKPSIVASIASCIDLFALYTMYNDSECEMIADNKAIVSDIVSLKNDFSKSCHEVLNG